VSASELRTGLEKLERDSFSSYRQRYRHGTKSNNTLGSRLEKLARIIPHGIAFIQRNRRVTWEEFDRQVNRLANGLLDLGINKGERVGIVGFNSIEWMVANFAIAKVGAVSFFLDPKLTLGEIAYVIKDADAVAVIAEGLYASTVARVTEGMVSLRCLIVYDVGRVPQLVPPGAVIYDDLMIRHPATKPRLSYKVTNEDFAHLEYSLGSSGYYVGAVWDYQQLTKSLMMMMLSSYLPIVDRGQEEAAIDLHGAMFALPGCRALLRSGRRIFGSPIWKKLYLKHIGILMGTTFRIKSARRFGKEGYKVLPVCPLFFEACYNPTLGSILVDGSCTVFLPTPSLFDVQEFCRIVEKEKVNMVVISGDAFAIPVVEELRRMEREGRRYDFSSLGIMFSTRVTWTPHLKKELLELIPSVIIVDGYGARGSGVAYVCINCSVDEEMTPIQIKVDREGVYAFQDPCKVINPETGEEVKPGSGETGEFLTGGHSALGFWKDPEETKRAFKVVNGCKYFCVGDLGYVDEGGWFHLTGRRGVDIIETGEKEVYVVEVEGVIRAHPKVRDVGIVALPDEELGGAIAACIQTQEGQELTEEDVIKYCSQRLVDYKVPKHVLFVESIPRATSGKIEKRMLTEFAQARVGEQT
jgi:acyl-CoA synthetase (AMP-forming)/AMP-acid ligase II